MAKFSRSWNPEFVGVIDPWRDVRVQLDSHERYDQELMAGVNTIQQFLVTHQWFMVCPLDAWKEWKRSVTADCLEQWQGQWQSIWKKIEHFCSEFQTLLWIMDINAVLSMFSGSVKLMIIGS